MYTTNARAVRRSRIVDDGSAPRKPDGLQSGSDGLVDPASRLLGLFAQNVCPHATRAGHKLLKSAM